MPGLGTGIVGAECGVLGVGRRFATFFIPYISYYVINLISEVGYALRRDNSYSRTAFNTSPAMANAHSAREVRLRAIYRTRYKPYSA